MIIRAGLFLATTSLLLAQTPSFSKFEVAAVHLVTDDTPIDLFGGPGTNDPGRIRYILSMDLLLARAYGIRKELICGPGWLTGMKVRIDANLPPETSKEQLNLMLRNLLIERFELSAHLEPRGQSGFELIVAKNGPKLKVDDSAGERTYKGSGRTGDFHMNFAKFTMPEFAEWLRSELDGPVSDQTELADRYDFTLEYAPNNRFLGSPPDAQAPAIADAVEKQLGLKLERQRESVDTLVVDFILKKPTEN